MRWSTGGDPSASQLPSLAAMSERQASEAKSVGKIPEIFDVKRAGMPPWPPSRDTAALSAHPMRLSSPEKNFWNKRLEG